MIFKVPSNPNHCMILGFCEVRLEGSSGGYVVEHQFKEEPTSKWDLTFLKFSEVAHSKANFITLSF